ncbi:hypothetical protein ACIA49_19210 [Kribbella sp. NPDC051587]|uniref:hypothetical protein n=1 Tax=Kribbella sp. NPDC051587 TaxID=3364119 RepID=UPI00379A7489
MRRVLMALAILLPLAGCSTDKPAPAPPSAPTPSASTPKPLTSVVVTKPKQKLLPSSFDDAAADEHASLTQQIVTKLELRTQVLAGFAAKTTGRCPKFQLKAGAVSQCTVTYSGQTVKWQVTIAKNYKPGVTYLAVYEIKPLQGVLVRDAVYATWYDTNVRKDLRCDAIPAVQVVTIGTKTPYRCEVLQPLQGGSAYWFIAPVTLSEAGLIFY